MYFFLFFFSSFRGAFFLFLYPNTNICYAVANICCLIDKTHFFSIFNRSRERKRKEKRKIHVERFVFNFGCITFIDHFGRKSFESKHPTIFKPLCMFSFNFFPFDFCFSRTQFIFYYQPIMLMLLVVPTHCLLVPCFQIFIFLIRYSLIITVLAFLAVILIFTLSESLRKRISYFFAKTSVI